MNHSYILFIATFAYGLHVLEEYTLGWQSWAHKTLKLPVNWNNFYMTNALVIIFGFSAAFVGWRLPAFALMFPAVMLINGIFFHILPCLVTRRFSPGVFTAVVFFLPIGLWAYWGAFVDGVLNAKVLAVSILGGVLLMAYPVVLLKIAAKKK